MSDVIYNETGIGNLKDKTPFYNFNIPYFDIATWHDYIEENFRNIDALFHYLYEIKQFKGKWENNTSYIVNDVVFIVDTNSEYNGRLIQVLVEHTTTDVPFSEFYSKNPDYYQFFLDAHAAKDFAIEAKNAAESAQQAEINTKNYIDENKVELEENYYTKNEVDTKDVVYYNMVKADIDHVKLEFNAKIGQIDDVLDAINGEKV